MTLAGRALRPGGFSWLVVHELRLEIRATRLTGIGQLAIVLLILYLGLGIAIALGLRGVSIEGGPTAYTTILALSILMMSFMATQALLRSQHTLYDSGDLDLLLSAPLPPHIVLLAKLCGIAAGVVLSFAVLVLPIAIPIAVLGHPGLFGIPALITALALISACLGLAITIAIVTVASPRAARTVGQITAALLGGGIFIVSQFRSYGGNSRRGGGAVLDWLTSHGIGASGFGALPGRAALGDPAAAALLLGLGIAIFAVTGLLLGRSFLAGYQSAGMRLSGRRGAATGSIARHFHAELFATVVAKEWRLLARDPALVFQVVLRLIYLAPLVLLVFGRDRGVAVAPSIAFASVLIAGQLVGSFAWLAISAEDAPDLIAVAPVVRAQVDRAKLATALAMAAPLGLIAPAALALISPLGALVTLAMTAAGGALSGRIEIAFQQPAPRKTFARRGAGGFASGLLGLIVTGLFGGGAAAIVSLLG